MRFRFVPKSMTLDDLDDDDDDDDDDERIYFNVE